MTQATIVRGLVVLPTRRIPLSEEGIERQISRGLFTEYKGQRYALPIDGLGLASSAYNGIDWQQDDVYGWHREGVIWTAPKPKPSPNTGGMVVRGTIAGVHWHRDWAAPDGELHEPLDHTFNTTPSHPGHVERFQEACARHRDMYGKAAHTCPSCWWEPLHEFKLRGKLTNGDRFLGFTEHLGILSMNLMTTAFDAEIIDELFVTTSTEFADFDFHEVGTNAAAEANSQTALSTSSGIARDTGTPVDENPDYANDATVTADATESWEEHGLFNNATSVAMMDRNLTGGQAVNSSDQVTYQGTWTFTPES